MKKISLVFLLILSSCSLFAQQDKKEIEAAVVGFFNGLSLFNTDTLKYYTTSDFHLLETGQIWNMDTLVNKVIGRKNAKITRVNKFEFLKVEQSSSMAWVSYFNTAEFSLGEKHQTVRWLESAVLVKRDGRWKIQMLHSTDLK